MGIYSRYAASFLILLGLSGPALSAYRTNFNPTSEQILKNAPASTASFQTPSGAVALYGEDALYELRAGNKFSAGDAPAPTIRPAPTSPIGTPQFPYGPGAAYPNDPAYNASAATNIKVKPVATVPKARILLGLKNVLKASPAQIASTVFIGGALSAVGWLIEDGAKFNKPGELVISKPSPGLVDGLGLPFAGTGVPVTCSASPGFYDGHNGWDYIISHGAPYRSNGFDYTSNCDPKPYFRSQRPHQPVVVSPSSSTQVTDSDFTSTLDPYVSSQTAPWLAGLLKDVCAASISPPRCFAEMEDRDKRIIQGPSSLPGMSTTTTSSYTRPDGTLGIKGTTTNTNYTFNYGPNYFDTNTTTTTTNTTDGNLTSTDTTTDTTPTAPADPNTDEETPPEESYTYNDSALPAVEPFYTQKYPDGFQGVWNSAKNDFDNSAFVSFLKSFIPSFSGSCPAFSLSFNISSWANYGVQNFSSLCYVLDFVKACIMLGALFLCRAIVFGG